MFCVGTVWDHVALWRSVYKIHLLTDTDVTFVLTTGGHNAGIVSEPGHPGRSYQIATRNAEDRFVDPETWQATTPQVDGSWWPAWESWLSAHSIGEGCTPPMGSEKQGYPPLCEAPGAYVLEE
jgi:polyhydroxyalkanoate synthase